jgi:aryl-alcohol dehydrogenase-like predicted oxidoreductase
MTFGYQSDRATSFAIMDRAVEGGVTFFDSADVYPRDTLENAGRSEEFVGDWLQERGGRDRIVLATKCAARVGTGPNDAGLSRRHIIAAVEASLHRLKTDYIDLYQAHSADPSTPIDETLRAFDDLVRSGKVRYAGCSNYRTFQLAKALWTSERLGLARYDSLQPRYNILYREIENELLPLCEAEGVGVIVYNPLAGGFLTGKYRRDQEPSEATRFTVPITRTSYRKRYWHDAWFDAVADLQTAATAEGVPLAQVAVAWVLGNPVITSAIVGATSPGQLDQTLGAAEVKLSDPLRAACDDVWFDLPRLRDADVALR